MIGRTLIFPLERREVQEGPASVSNKLRLRCADAQLQGTPAQGIAESGRAPDRIENGASSGVWTRRRRNFGTLDGIVPEAAGSERRVTLVGELV